MQHHEGTGANTATLFRVVAGGPLETSRRFTFNSCLGRGGFGEVYRATLEAPGGLVQDVAVKVLRSDLDMKDDAVRRLRDEGRLLGYISHPAIPKVVDLVRLDGRIALVTEFVDGRDLGDALASDDPPALRVQLQVLGQVASALDAALTARGPSGSPLQLVHRDVKPENIRLGRHGDTKLLDFGIAWSASSQREAQTATGLVVGSLPWMAPERFVAPRCSSAADVFAIGSVLFSGLSGFTLYEYSAMPKVAAIATDAMRYRDHIGRQLSRLGTAVPAAVIDLLDDMVAFSPEARPTVGEVAERLDLLSDGLEGPTLRSWARSHPWPDATDLGGDWVGRRVEAETLSHLRPPVTEATPPPLPPRLARAAGKAQVMSAPKTTIDAGSTRWEQTPVPTQRRASPPPTMAPMSSRPAPPPTGVFTDRVREPDVHVSLSEEVPLAGEELMEGVRPSPTMRPDQPLTSSDLDRTPIRPPVRGSAGSPTTRPSAVATQVESLPHRRPSQVATMIDGTAPRPSAVPTLLDPVAAHSSRGGRRPAPSAPPPEPAGISPVMAGVAVFFAVLLAGVLVAIGVLGGALLAGL